MSKASLVFTQLNQPVSLDSNTCTTSLFGGRERLTFDISFSMQPLKALAELHFPGMNHQILCIVSDQFSKFWTGGKYLENYVNHYYQIVCPFLVSNIEIYLDLSYSSFQTISCFSSLWANMTIFRNGVETIKCFDILIGNYTFSSGDQIKNSAKNFWNVHAA